MVDGREARVTVRGVAEEPETGTGLGEAERSEGRSVIDELQRNLIVARRTPLQGQGTRRRRAWAEGKLAGITEDERCVIGDTGDEVAITESAVGGERAARREREEAIDGDRRRLRELNGGERRAYILQYTAVEHEASGVGGGRSVITLTQGTGHPDVGEIGDRQSAGRDDGCAGISIHAQQRFRAGTDLNDAQGRAAVLDDAGVDARGGSAADADGRGGRTAIGDLRAGGDIRDEVKICSAGERERVAQSNRRAADACDDGRATVRGAVYGRQANDRLAEVDARGGGDADRRAIGRGRRRGRLRLDDGRGGTTAGESTEGHRGQTGCARVRRGRDAGAVDVERTELADESAARASSEQVGRRSGQLKRTFIDDRIAREESAIAAENQRARTGLGEIRCDEPRRADGRGNRQRISGSRATGVDNQFIGRHRRCDAREAGDTARAARVIEEDAA